MSPIKADILIVDDEERLGQVLSMVLTRAGFGVRTFTDGRLAIASLEERQPDLVITDLSMPVMDGIEVLKRVKAKDKDIPVILITAHATVKSAVTAMKEGAYDYIIKPFDNEELRALVANALAVGQLSRENKYLRTELKTRYLVDGMIGESRAMKEVFDLVGRVAQSKATVLVTGESGTGKELVARAIHYGSSRVGGPFVAVNLKALTESLLEAEMFGYEKGAFTGATGLKKGRFELAHGGSLFLDEIGEISESFQGKLLRVLQLGQFERVGGTQTIEVDVRFIAATNRDLQKEVAEGRFREDLFFRLNVIPLRLPPLRERPDDILPLAWHFLRKYVREVEKPVEGFTSELEEVLMSYDWPGNVRELENSMERGVVLARGKLLEVDDLLLRPALPRPASAGGDGTAPGPAGPVYGHVDTTSSLENFLDGAAATHIRDVLEACNGKKVKAAETLGINRATLYRLMKKYGIHED